MTRCPDKTERVLYAAGELPDARRRDVDVHLRKCDACRRDVAALARGLAALEALDREPGLRPETLAVLRSRLRRAAPARRPRRILAAIPLHYRWIAAAAAIVLALAVWDLGRTRPVPDWDADAVTEIAAAVELLELDDSATAAAYDTTPDQAPDDADHELQWLLEQNDTDLLLEYLLSEENHHG